ncbi:cell wall assembly and cell proliferation coordinating protein [Venturia nashicola]|uniref:Cell wall assembly and cell proliferation coordinating protein n=1 Tax=Venturia nashicola TaxID=86259 RepID=A0A4Z1P5L8_9PEZI|nr:cell wall assembly and cell proliferation coordinating protein [Venturia nashicola]TLD30187.1 cell wall assembly and cell proliferation coordinating protein [Venturia nashicola]
MAPSITDTWRTFWHSMTSNDRHASHDSPYRSGQHVPLPQSRHTPLTSVATSAMESRHDVSEMAQQSNGPLNGFASPVRAMSPNPPYSPGMRSELRRQSKDQGSRRSSVDKQPTTEIQMQSFSDGLPPPPPVTHSWKRIDRWAEENYEELRDNLCEGATTNDINDLEHQLDCTLPIEIRESIGVHDGQEHGGRPTGIIFGCMLLDCEEIVEEWKNWRLVNEEYLAGRPDSFQTPQIPVKAFAGPSTSTSTVIPEATKPNNNPLWRNDLLEKQKSQPPNAVQKAYAHPAWIPLARDWGGNLIAVDLAPGPAGTWGQIIIFGRDYDTKFVIARSWASFLATVADDLGSGDKVIIDDESGDLKFKCFKDHDPPYLEILRWRCDQKYGRRPNSLSGMPKKRGSGLRINASVGGFDKDASPYGSPTSAPSERGRSPQRFVGSAGKAPAAASPLRSMVSSPLARVAEEGIKPLKLHTDSESLIKTTSRTAATDRLVSAESPRPSGDFGPGTPVLASATNQQKPPETANGRTNGPKLADSGIGEMKSVEI